ncbi:MAG: hypothetical protein HQ562_08625 [Candidatus Marinimicrobia bacterium]|nr:hypothetical protein [Candidatus Neomarinimicrobiota bacterium]
MIVASMETIRFANSFAFTRYWGAIKRRIPEIITIIIASKNTSSICPPSINLAKITEDFRIVVTKQNDIYNL